jgi:enamine deaminase RidA (YjgF/YER057c/UK114 family)
VIDVLSPDGWPRPSGYSNGVAAFGRCVFIAGQVGWDPTHNSFECDSLTDQVRQALKNVVAVLAAAGGRPEHLTRMTWYVNDRREYVTEREQIGKAYIEVIGRHFPAMTLVQAILLEDRAKVEIEATAVLPH